MGAGHGGASRHESLKEIAFEYAFVIDRLGFDFDMSPKLSDRREQVLHSKYRLGSVLLVRSRS